MKNDMVVKVFNDNKIRTQWDADKEEWYFSVVDVCAILTDKQYDDARKYWKVLKGRLKNEGSELVSFCYQLNLLLKIFAQFLIYFKLLCKQVVLNHNN